MWGFLLLIIATVLKVIIGFPAYLYGSFVTSRKGEFDAYDKSLAIASDQFGNVLCAYLFNTLLITKDGYRFGNIRETISSVVGKNKVKGTLTRTGKALDFILGLLDKNHSIKSINNDV